MSDRAESGKQASIDGFAHEKIVCGILMKIFQNVSIVDLPLSTYDIIVVLKHNGDEDTIRIQVKTATKSVSFTGGTRGGVDRTYKSGVKTYVQSTTTSDVIIGITPRDTNQYDLYYVPTMLVEVWGQKSKSINLLEPLKNNPDIIYMVNDPLSILEFAHDKDLITDDQLKSVINDADKL